MNNFTHIYAETDTCEWKLKNLPANSTRIYRDLNKFFRLLHTVRQVRNICAHSGILFDYTLPLSVNSIPQIAYNIGDRNSLDASIKVIGFFIQCISENRFNDFQNEIKSFFNERKKDPFLAKVIKDHIKYLD